MPVFQYGRVVLPYPNITDFSQDVVYDESDTDWFINKFDISVECYVNFNYVSLLDPDIGRNATDNAADIMRLIHTRLMQPRQKLSVMFNGVELIPKVDANPGTTDSQNGPKPRGCKITQLTNTTFIINYHITANYWVKVSVDAGVVRNVQGSPVLYNRWKETVEMDNCQMSTRTREGKYIIRSDNNTGAVADKFRSQMAVVSVPNGFLRQRSRYTVSPDGLGVEYSVIDKEYYRIPPSPAFEAKGHYREDTASVNGATRNLTVVIHLKGDKNTPQTLLIDKATKIAASKLASRGAVLNPGDHRGKRGIAIISSASLQQDFYENSVSFQVTGFCKATSSRKQAIGAFANLNTNVPGSGVDTPSPTYLDRGTASLALQAASYYDPSLPQNNLGFDFGGTRSKDNPITGSEGENAQMAKGILPGQGGAKVEPAPA